MNSDLDTQFYTLLNKYNDLSGLRKFWKLKELFSSKSPHMIFIIQYYVIKHIFNKNKISPNQDFGVFMKSLAKNLAVLKNNIEGNDHISKVQKIKNSVLSFFGNCQEMYNQKLYSTTLSKK
jgi:hypothetical protein